MGGKVLMSGRRAEEEGGNLMSGRRAKKWEVRFYRVEGGLRKRRVRF